MIREFELEVLNAIQFGSRYVRARIKYTRNPLAHFTLTSPEVKALMKNIENYKFKNSGHVYWHDRKHDNWTFRLLLDINYKIVLTKIYILYDDKFLNTGTIQLGKVFNDYFNDQNYTNENFGFNFKHEMLEFIALMIEIYEDFDKEYTLRLEGMDEEQKKELIGSNNN